MIFVLVDFSASIDKLSNCRCSEVDYLVPVCVEFDNSPGAS